MDFAKRELAKYGWRRGQGLGKSNSGIVEAIKPVIKNDLNGIGYDETDDKSFKWWEYSFNKAASNVSVVEIESGLSVVKKSESSISNISIGRPRKKRKHDNLIHGNFCKEGSNEDSDQIDDQSEKFVHNLSDEDLFRICGGRTVHKGARNGLKLKGKLSRLAKQELIVNEDFNVNNNVSSLVKENHCKKVRRKKKL